MIPLQARRTFRLSLTIAMSVVFAYGLALPLPFLSPVFAILLTSTPAPPLGVKKLLGLIVVLMLTLGVGLLLIPILINYAISAILMIAAGLYFSTYFSASPDKAMLGTLFTVGFTIIPAAGLASFPLALMVIESLIVGVGLAVICSWMVYPFFPEDKDFTEAPPEPVTDENSNWMALRVTLIVLPPFLAALANPALYLKLIMKSVVMGKQATAINARAAGRELLGATFLGGALAIVLWIMLDLVTNLWMFFWLMLLMGIYVGSKIYQVNPSRFSAPFWVDVMVTMIILLGSAVQDSADGQDVYQAFTMRMSFFVLLALYAWLAIVMLDRVRNNHVNRKYQAPINKESEQC